MDHQYWSLRDVAAYLQTQRLASSPSTISRWGKGGPWSFPLPDQSTAASPLWRAERVKEWARAYARVKHLSGYQLTHLLKTYAALGATCRPQRMPLETVEVAEPPRPFIMTESIFEGMRNLVAAYRVLEETWSEEFDFLVKQSNQKLGCEPLLLPALAVCAIENENAVSDVLAELLKLLPKVAVFEALELTMNLVGDGCPQWVEREWPVAMGHPDKSGRLDITAVYPDEERLVFEVKLGHADQSDLAKNEGYTRSLNNSGAKYCAVALVYGRSPNACGHGFALRDWRAVLLGFRRVIARCRDPSVPHRHLAALILVGMLERRVLHLNLERRLAHLDTLRYLRYFTGAPV